MQTSVQPSFNVGDTIRYHHFIDGLHRREIFTGTIMAVGHSKIFGGLMYRVQPEADDRLADLSPKWIYPGEIAGQVIEETVDQQDALQEIGAAFQAWETAFFNGRMEEARRLSEKHDVLVIAHELRIRPSYRTATIPAQTVAPQDVETIAVQTAAPKTHRKSGVVRLFNAAQAYGYILSEGQDFYFRAANKMYLDMPIKTGDAVTFQITSNLSAEGGQDKATRILVDGYTPTPRKLATPDMTAARETERARKQVKKDQRLDRKAQDQRNAANMSAMLTRKAK